MAGPLHDLKQLLGKANLRIRCGWCRHENTVASGDVVMRFAVRRWSTDWHAAHVRFRCSRCNSKDVSLWPDFYSYELARQQAKPERPLKSVPTALKPGLRPPPPGIDLEAWNAADERERKRLVDRARG